MTRIPPRLARSLRQRLLGAAVALPLVLVPGWAGGLWVTVVASMIAARSGWELDALARAAGLRPIRWVIPLLATLLVVAADDAIEVDWQTPAVLLGAGALVVVVMAPVLVVRQGAAQGGKAWLASVAGAAYVGFPLAAAVLLRQGDHGREWLFLALLATFATDASAYGIGSLWGRRPLARAISPNKTWEGAVGGLAGSMVVTVGLVAILGLPFVAWATVALGAGIGLVAQVGDLAESKLKRLAGVRESGTLIPGHGGLLDRTDSLVLVLPLVYYVAMVWPKG